MGKTSTDGAVKPKALLLASLIVSQLVTSAISIPVERASSSSDNGGDESQSTKYEDSAVDKALKVNKCLSNSVDCFSNAAADKVELVSDSIIHGIQKSSAKVAHLEDELQDTKKEASDVKNALLYGVEPAEQEQASVVDKRSLPFILFSTHRPLNQKDYVEDDYLKSESPTLLDLNDSNRGAGNEEDSSNDLLGPQLIIISPQQDGFTKRGGEDEAIGESKVSVTNDPGYEGGEDGLQKREPFWRETAAIGAGVMGARYIHKKAKKAKKAKKRKEEEALMFGKRSPVNIHQHDDPFQSDGSDKGVHYGKGKEPMSDHSDGGSPGASSSGSGSGGKAGAGGGSIDPPMPGNGGDRGTTTPKPSAPPMKEAAVAKNKSQLGRKLGKAAVVAGTVGGMIYLADMAHRWYKYYAGTSRDDRLYHRSVDDADQVVTLVKRSPLPAQEHVTGEHYQTNLIITGEQAKKFKSQERQLRWVKYGSAAAAAAALTGAGSYGIYKIAHHDRKKDGDRYTEDDPYVRRDQASEDDAEEEEGEGEGMTLERRAWGKLRSPFSRAKTSPLPESQPGNLQVATSRPPKEKKPLSSGAKKAIMGVGALTALTAVGGASYGIGHHAGAAGQKKDDEKRQRLQQQQQQQKRENFLMVDGETLGKRDETQSAATEAATKTPKKGMSTMKKAGVVAGVVGLGAMAMKMFGGKKEQAAAPQQATADPSAQSGPDQTQGKREVDSDKQPLPDSFTKQQSEEEKADDSKAALLPRSHDDFFG